MSIRLSGPEALAELLEYIARELRSGTVEKISIETIESDSKALVTFNTHMVPAPDFSTEEPTRPEIPSAIRKKANEFDPLAETKVLDPEDSLELRRRLTDEDD